MDVKQRLPGGVMQRRMLVRGETYRVPAEAAALRVRSGKAWLSMGGEDVILGRGEVIPVGNPLARRDFGLVSPVGRLPLLIEILGRPTRSRLAPRAGTLWRAR